MTKVIVDGVEFEVVEATEAAASGLMKDPNGPQLITVAGPDAASDWDIVTE